MMWYGVRDDITPYYFIVEDYFNKKMLSKLGYSFEGASVTDFEVEAYTVIAVEAARLESDELKKSRK